VSHELDSSPAPSPNGDDCPLVQRLRDLARAMAAASLDSIHYANTVPWVAANHIVNLTSRAMWETEDSERLIACLRDNLAEAHSRIEELRARVAELEGARIAPHARITIQDSTIGLE
jgi:hypothetical protein